MGMYKHETLPKDGSITRESDGAPVDGTDDNDYPLQARCRSCNRALTAKTADDTRWKHAGARPRKPTGTLKPAYSP